eukprot:scaffold2180_cov168-Amphora_coffeaeformis.AAC.3
MMRCRFVDTIFPGHNDNECPKRGRDPFLHRMQGHSRKFSLTPCVTPTTVGLSDGEISYPPFLICPASIGMVVEAPASALSIA